MSDQDDRKHAIYLRVSTIGQAEEGESLDEQGDRLRAFCKYKGWEEVEVYREEGRSGKDINRPELQRLLADIEGGLVQTVIVKKLDRLSRSIIDFENLYGLFREHTVDLVSLQENFDTTTAIGRGVVRIVMVFAQLEREQVSERTTDIMKHMARQGRYLGRHLMLGYDLVDKALVVNETEAAIVREIFESYLEQGSYAKTARALNKKGYRTKRWTTKTGKEYGGKRFNKNNVGRHLTDVCYIGKVRHKDEVYEGLQEAIVNEGTFHRVQETLDRNRVETTSSRPKETFLLKGLVRCAACKSAMTPATALGRGKRRYRYYQCVQHQDPSKEKCPIGRAKADELERLVVDEMKHLAEDPTIVEEVVQETCRQSAEQAEELKAKKKGLVAELQDLKAKADKILDVVARVGDQGRKTDRLLDRLDELQEQERALKGQVETLEFQIRDAESRIISVEVVRDNFKTFKEVWDHLELHEQEELLQLLIKKITYYEGPKLMTPGKKGRKKKVTPGKIRVEFFDIGPLGAPEALLRARHPGSVNRYQGVFRTAFRWAPLPPPTSELSRCRRGWDSSARSSRTSWPACSVRRRRSSDVSRSGSPFRRSCRSSGCCGRRGSGGAGSMPERSTRPTLLVRRASLGQE